MYLTTFEAGLFEVTVSDCKDIFKPIIFLRHILDKFIIKITLPFAILICK